MKLKGLLKVALVLLAISTMFVACDTLAGGKFPPIFTPFTPEAGTVYVQMPETWLGNKAYGAWIWADGGAGSWYDLEVVDETEGIFSCDVPADKQNIIFVAFTSETKDWANKKEQTADLKVPTDEKVLYVIQSSSWVDPTGKAEIPELPEDPEDPEEPAIVLTPASSTGVWSYTLPIAEISGAWGGKPEKAAFQIMLMTDEEVAAAKHADAFKLQSGNIEIYTHEAGNFSIKGLTGVAATITETDLTVFVDGDQLNLAEGKKPYVLALASKANAPEDFCFSDWGETMKMTPEATYPTNLKENAAPAGTPEGWYQLTHYAGEMNGWTHTALVDNSFEFESDGSSKQFKFTCGDWSVGLGKVTINGVGEFVLGSEDGDNATLSLPAGKYKITLIVESKDVAKVKVEKI